ncbi:MAG: hypothetical protein QOD92_3886 [Acidimicrobiaceae bacterium]
MNPRRHRRPTIVWVPVGTNIALVVIAAGLKDATAVALTAVGAVVATGAVVVYLRESELDKERIAHLQAAIPAFNAPLDADAAVNLAPKPSPVVAEVLRQMRPVVPPDVVSPRQIPPTVPIDRS